MEKVDVSKIEKLIQYCPHCGSNAEKDFVGILWNGGAWICDDCNEKVEAYVLSQ